MVNFQFLIVINIFVFSKPKERDFVNNITIRGVGEDMCQCAQLDFISELDQRLIHNMGGFP